MTYLTQAFDVFSLEQAKNVVLSPDPKNPNKFQYETDFLVDWLEKNTNISTDSVVLDYGCGMGRIAKSLINRVGCEVIGLDISHSMLMYAMIYIMSDIDISNVSKFTPTTKYQTPESVDMVLAVLSLQHVKDPQAEINNIVKVLKPNGQCVLVNGHTRMVPIGIDDDNFVIWENDEFNVLDYCESKMAKELVDLYVDPNYNVVLYKKV